MIKFVINGMVTIKNVPPFTMQKFKQDLTIANPQYEKTIKAGRKTWNMDPYLTMYVTRGETSIIVPRGYMNRAIFVANTKEFEIIDNTVCPEFKCEFTGVLRKYQELAVTDCTKRRYGILEAATGSGKTVMALATIPIRATDTLILVHNTELLNQWKDRIKTFLNYDCGIIGGGKCDIKGITVGIINSVTKISESIAKSFGYVIYDECHRSLGGTWLDTINTLQPKYHLGCTATPFRSDDTTKALYAVVGPKFHVVDKTMLEETGAILIPEIRRVQSDFYIINESEVTYQQIVAELTGDVSRNYLIAQAANAEYQCANEPILIVSDRVEHCSVLFDLISAYKNLEPLLLHGGIKKKDRKQQVAEFKEGKYNVLIATISLIGEGFDSPSLGALFLTTPVKFNGRLIQTIGRILRPSGDRKPRVYDVRDYGVNMLKYSAFARDRLYKSYGWEK